MRKRTVRVRIMLRRNRRVETLSTFPSKDAALKWLRHIGAPEGGRREWIERRSAPATLPERESTPADRLKVEA
jgi:hypothetical protein